jgi:hypothetical protein
MNVGIHQQSQKYIKYLIVCCNVEEVRIRNVPHVEGTFSRIAHGTQRIESERPPKFHCHCTRSQPVEDSTTLRILDKLDILFLWKNYCSFPVFRVHWLQGRQSHHHVTSVVMTKWARLACNPSLVESTLVWAEDAGAQKPSSNRSYPLRCRQVRTCFGRNNLFSK